MNERIKQLDEQAYQWAVNESKGGPNICAPGSDYFLAMEKKKFAELLIKECLQQCEQIRNDALTQKKSEFLTESGKMLYEGVYGGANNCGYAIQQHFGVEK
jgi:hypothetical protein